MIIASKQTIKKACKGSKLKKGGKCRKGGILMEKGGKSGIYIKPSKRGSFTAWCKKQGYGGVTGACISKGKNSNSTAIRKKATFASNARKWNH